MLENLFGSALRTSILSWLLSHPDQRYYVRQLEKILDADSTNLSRELAKLESMGILISTLEGRQKYFQVNRRCPIYPELEGIIRKTRGLATVLKDALQPISKKILVAFIYGSMATGSYTNESDVDLFIIGSCSFREVVDHISNAQNSIGREINPTVMPLHEWKEKLSSRNHFVVSMRTTDKLFIIGDEDGLGKIS
jgi:predicted nucleotidyltransferase